MASMLFYDSVTYEEKGKLGIVSLGWSLPVDSQKDDLDRDRSDPLPK